MQRPKRFRYSYPNFFHSLQIALEQSDNRDGKEPIPCPKPIHLPPTHWATPFTFLEKGVFLAEMIKIKTNIMWFLLHFIKITIPL
ncbi:hypothetical protein BAMA_21380 [Bacillus manliponensis]|uniref:Uncharacterized protein n=1 Tax=Bacillus manliponensis TaxID=574376 RepID=A0A073JZX8_9BACI|nr:hypothetical protein BAMA_21380 [Bacillus manliponensis]